MARYSVTVQRDQAAHRSTGRLEAGLVRLGVELLGDEADADDGPTVSWTVMEPGYMFTEGEPSTSSMVIRSVDAELGAADRERFMRAICDLWVETTIPGPLPF